MLVLEQKRPREVCIPALRAIPHPGNGTQHQRCIYGNTFKQIQLLGFVWRALAAALQSCGSPCHAQPISSLSSTPPSSTASTTPLRWAHRSCDQAHCIASEELKYATKELTPREALKLGLCILIQHTPTRFYFLDVTESPLIFRVEWACFCWRTYQQLNIKRGSEAKCPGRIAWVCFLLETTAVKRHSQHLESCAMITGAANCPGPVFSAFRRGCLVLLFKTLLPALSPSLLCHLSKSPMDSAVFSIYMGMWHAVIHLSFGCRFSAWTLKLLHGQLQKKLPPYPQYQKPLCVCMCMLYTHTHTHSSPPAAGTNTYKVFPQKGGSDVITPPQNTKTPKIKCAELQGKGIPAHESAQTSSDQNPALPGTIILMERTRCVQFPVVGKAGAGNRSYK